MSEEGYQNRPVVVTGAAGYLGAVLCHRLLESGAAVRGVDSIRYGGDALLGLMAHSGFTFVRADIRDSGSLSRVIEGASEVVHLAALVGEPICKRFPDEARQVNFEATCSLAELSKKLGVELLVFASTCSNYGRTSTGGHLDEDAPLQPLSLYSETKIAAERHVIGLADNAFRTVVLRFATLFGVSPAMRFDLLVQEFVRDAACRSQITVYGADAWRPFLHVRDAAEAVVRVLRTRPTGASSVWNVGDNRLNCCKGDLARLVLERYPGARLQETTGVEDPRDYRVSFDRFRQTYGFRAARSLRSGIGEIAQLIEDKVVGDPYDPRYNKVSPVTRQTEG